MRLTFIVTQFPCLSETFVLQRIVGMIERGHDVRIVAMHHGHDPFAHPEVARHKLLERTTYICPSEPARGPGSPVNWLRAQLTLTQVWPDARSHSHLTYLGQSIRNRCIHWAETRAARREVAWIRSVAPRLEPADLTFAVFGENGLRALKLLSFGFNGGRLVTSFHGADLSRDLSIHGEQLYATLLSELDPALPVCRYLQHRLTRLGLPAERMSIAPSGIDVTRYSVTTRRRREFGPIKVVTAGRRHKAIADFLGVPLALRRWVRNAARQLKSLARFWRSR